MSFAVWKEKPPFTFEPEDREQVYQVGDVWVVTDDPARATQAEVDAALAPLPPDNGAALEQSRRDTLKKEIESQIGSLSEDQQAVLRNVLKLIDKET